jgi:hypothetical protein
MSHQVKITADIGFINEHHDHTWNIHGCKVRTELCGLYRLLIIGGILWFPLLVCGMYHGYYHYNLWHMEAPRKL